MKLSVTFKIFVLAVAGFCCLHKSVTAQNIPVPNKQQLAWQQAELGVLISYDLHVLDTSKYVQSENRITPIADYNIFNPPNLNVEQWVLAAKAAGAKFAIFTVSHETGFSFYQSDVNPYCMKALKWKDGKGDLVREFVDACRKHDILPGLYMGIRWNSFFGVHDFKVNGEGQFQKNRQAYYNKMVEGMVTEICTRYGKLFEIWFDGGGSSPDRGGADILPIVKKYQPDCLFYHNTQLAETRWGGSESGIVNYPCWSLFPYPYTGAGESAPKEIGANDFALLKTGDPNGKYFMPTMADLPLRGADGRHEWFWEPGDERHIFSVDHLIDVYKKSVGRNATLIIGLTPDNKGLMPQPDVDTLAAFGKAVKDLFGSPIATLKPIGKKMELEVPRGKKANYIVIREDLSQGQRVREFEIWVQKKSKWELQFNGSSIGNKCIVSLPDNSKYKKIKLLIKKSIGNPLISELAVY
ncbi:MAG: alpha-L-fucosidase [Bacteroidetes bacterium]|nr:alpha-L-fucosidase [Bacteroidota bacterium]